MAKDLSLSSSILERDSEINTRAFQDTEQSLASFGNLVEEIKTLTDSFLSCSVSYVKRKGNFVSQNLARYVKHVSSSVIWVEEVPPHIVPILMADFS